MYGKRHSVETLQKMRALKYGEKNPLWRGNDVGLKQLHQWIRSRKRKPLYCERCAEKPPFDLVSIGHIYKRDLTTWRWLCRRCHMIIENRIHNLDKYLAKRRKSSALPSL